MKFNLESDFLPTGDQPEAIRQIVNSFSEGEKHVTLQGVTGSGKTFTVANTIKELQRPTLVLAHNKTLAAQLYSEFKQFFPENAVEYFVFTMIITSQRPTFQPVDSILKKIFPLMRKLRSCEHYHFITFREKRCIGCCLSILSLWDW